MRIRGFKSYSITEHRLPVFFAAKLLFDFKVRLVGSVIFSIFSRHEHIFLKDSWFHLFVFLIFTTKAQFVSLSCSWMLSSFKSPCILYSYVLKFGLKNTFHFFFSYLSVLSIFCFYFQSDAVLLNLIFDTRKFLLNKFYFTFLSSFPIFSLSLLGTGCFHQIFL